MAIHCIHAKSMSHSHMESKINLLVLLPFSVQLHPDVDIISFWSFSYLLEYTPSRAHNINRQDKISFWGRRVNANLLALSKMEIWIWNCKEGGGRWQDCHVMCLSLQLSSQNTCFPRGNSDQTSNFYWLYNEYVFIYIFNWWGIMKLHSHSSP